MSMLTQALMYLVIYVSTANRDFPDSELDDLLKQSRAWNQSVNITGILLYKEGSFMQFLEGERNEVLLLLSKIRVDARHHGLIVLLQEEHRMREFSEWAMAYKKLDGDDLPEVPGYGDYLDLPLTSDKFLTNPTKTLELLLAFKKTLPVTADV